MPDTEPPPPPEPRPAAVEGPLPTSPALVQHAPDGEVVREAAAPLGRRFVILTAPPRV